MYFDTQDLRLARWGVSLRHREGQGWTTKLPAEDARGELLIRGGHVPRGGPPNPPDEARPIRAYVRSCVAAARRSPADDRRKIQLLDLDDRLLGEVVDDEVSVLSAAGSRRGSASSRWRSPTTRRRDPRRGADRLRTAGAGSRADPEVMRAVGPLATQAPEIEVAPLTADATVSQVLGRALAMSVEQLLRHDAVVRLDADPEGVHQTRGRRGRLRSDLRTFRPMVDPSGQAAPRGAPVARDDARRSARRRRAARPARGADRDGPRRRSARCCAGDRGAPAAAEGGAQRDDRSITGDGTSRSWTDWWKRPAGRSCSPMPTFPFGTSWTTCSTDRGVTCGPR